MDMFPPKKLTTPTRCVCTNNFRGLPYLLYVYVVVFVSGKILLQKALDNLIGEADSMLFTPQKSDQTTLVVQCLVFQKFCVVQVFHACKKLEHQKLLDGAWKGAR